MLRAAFRNPFERSSAPPSVVAIIPSRYESVRLPGKPLLDIGGRPMIEHVYRRSAEAPGVDAVVVATDDPRIADAVEAFGGIVRMTDRSHRTGTDRIAEVARHLECDTVVNVQGDEPLIEPALVGAVARALRDDPTLEMSTACRPIGDPDDYRNPHVVKVVTDATGRALYFSRAPIPFDTQDWTASGTVESSVPRALKHYGIYGYRRSFLLQFAAWPRTPLEMAESLEQLRALEHGVRIGTVRAEHDSIGVDTANDLARVRHLVAAIAR